MSSPSCLMVDLKQRIYLTNTGDTKIQVSNSYNYDMVSRET